MSWPGSKVFDTDDISVKEFFEKGDFEKSRQQKSMRDFPVCKDLNLGTKWFYLHWWNFSGLFLNSGFWGWLSVESQPQNPVLGRFLWLLWFNFSLSKDNWPFKLEIVNIYRQTASFKIWFSKVQDFENFELSPMYLILMELLYYRSTLHTYDESSGGLNEKIPFFRADITLAIPNVVCIIYWTLLIVAHTLAWVTEVCKFLS